MTEEQLLEAFEYWWARNHPWGWYCQDEAHWSALNKQRMWAMCRNAFLRKERSMEGWTP